jgi:hypothetical protein
VVGFGWRFGACLHQDKDAGCIIRVVLDLKIRWKGIGGGGRKRVTCTKAREQRFLEHVKLVRNAHSAPWGDP